MIALVLPGAVAASAADRPLKQVSVNAFVSASNLPLWAGEQQGFFGDEGIAIAFTSPSGSIDQMRGFTSGRTQILITAFDNVVAYQRGQGASEIGTIPDVVAVAGVDNGLLTLVGTPSVTGIQDLKGATLAVDAATTGFTFALKGVLVHAGLDPTNQPLVAVGNTAGRWKALQEGRASGAVLTTPVDAVAVEKGYRALTTVPAALGPYLGNVVAVHRGWADQNRQLLSGFLRAYRRSIAWTVDPSHREAAIEILERKMPDLGPDLADRVYRRLVDPREGLFRDMAMTSAELRTVLGLRKRFGPPSDGSEDPDRYVDRHFLMDSTK